MCAAPITNESGAMWFTGVGACATSIHTDTHRLQYFIGWDTLLIFSTLPQKQNFSTEYRYSRYQFKLFYVMLLKIRRHFSYLVYKETASLIFFILKIIFFYYTDLNFKHLLFLLPLKKILFFIKNVFKNIA